MKCIASTEGGGYLISKFQLTSIHSNDIKFELLGELERPSPMKKIKLKALEYEFIL